VLTGRHPTRAPRVGIVFQGDASDPSAWSGVPAGLAGGLTAAGAEVVPVDARFPGSGRIANALKFSWADATANGGFAAASSSVASRRLRRARVDGALAIGSGFMLDTDLPVVTYEDMTVAEALRRDDPVYRALKPAAARRWIERQRRIYERARGCCAASNWVADSVREEYGIAADRVHVVGIGRNMDRDSPPQREWSAPRFLFVGFDWERKRGPAVVEAFAAVRERWPEATLDLVGGHPAIEAPGVTGHGPLPLRDPESRRRYAEILDRATCFLMPSTYEPFGIAYLDAGAAGVPSIGTTVGGSPDAVGPGGMVVDPSDPTALVTAMLELADPETAQRLGALAVAHSALLTWQTVGERVLRALRLPGVDPDSLSPFLEASPRKDEER
jgi:glycosyltransferase involved in cell wall biosynthesis